MHSVHNLQHKTKPKTCFSSHQIILKKRSSTYLTFDVVKVFMWLIQILVSLVLHYLPLIVTFELWNCKVWMWAKQPWKSFLFLQNNAWIIVCLSWIVIPSVTQLKKCPKIIKKLIFIQIQIRHTDEQACIPSCTVIHSPIFS